MRYVTPDEIQQAKRLDLLSYLRVAEPQELVLLFGENYCTKEQDSLKISNGKWHWFSRGIGGRSAVDYLVKVKGYPFPAAVQMVLAKTSLPLPPPAPVQKQKQTLLLPELVEGHPSKVAAYLKSRCIDESVIHYCVAHKLLFESADYHNAVFVGYDRDGIARYAAFRSINSTYKAEASGSNKRYSFSICANQSAQTLHVFESAIDLLSYATLEQQAGWDWKRDALLSLAGVFRQKRDAVVPVSLSQFLADHPSVQRIYLHLDNDEAGRNAARGILAGLRQTPFELYNCPPTDGKDVNEQLQIINQGGHL